MKRVLTITVSEKGELQIDGDSFTVGEIEDIGSQLIRIVKSQNISFGQKPDPDLKFIKEDEPGEDKK